MFRPDIEPVRLNQLPKLAEELFGPTYRSHHLGLPGLWGGESRTELNLGEDVSLKEFVSVLRFRTPDCHLGPWENWSSDNPVVAYRLNYVGHPSLSTVWALGDSFQHLELRAARNVVTEKAMTLIESVAGMERRPEMPPEERGFLYASFQRGAAEDQTPRLETTVVIPRQFRKLDGVVVEPPVLLRPGAVTEIFSRIETRRLMGTVGALGLTAKTSMPENRKRAPNPMFSGSGGV